MNLGNPKRLPIWTTIAMLTTALSFTSAWQAPPNQKEGLVGLFVDTRKAKPGSKQRPIPVRRTTPDDSGGPRIGIGYSLYKCIDKREDQCKDRSKLVRVDTKKEVQTGDLARFVIEPNIDGFLYIFNAVNNGEPKMIFPHHRIKGGENKMKKHVPYEIPSRDLGWFEFKDKPEYAAFPKITEKLYIVVTRDPLPDVPTGSKLVDFCHQSGNECPWKLAKAESDRVLAKDGKVEIAYSLKVRETLADVSPKNEAIKMSSEENEAIENARELDLSEPEPSLVVMNVSPKQVKLVWETELIHKRSPVPPRNN